MPPKYLVTTVMPWVISWRRITSRMGLAGSALGLSVIAETCAVALRIQYICAAVMSCVRVEFFFLGQHCFGVLLTGNSLRAGYKTGFIYNVLAFAAAEESSVRIHYFKIIRRCAFFPL